jgi:hypothetical protein
MYLCAELYLDRWLGGGRTVEILLLEAMIVFHPSQAYFMESLEIR